MDSLPSDVCYAPTTRTSYPRNFNDSPYNLCPESNTTYSPFTHIFTPLKFATHPEESSLALYIILNEFIHLIYKRPTPVTIPDPGFPAEDVDTEA